jgi:hypothetical protein
MKLVCVVCLTEFDAAAEGEECPMCCCRQTKKTDEKGGDKA